MPDAQQESRFEVFISYRREDADKLALLLQTALQKQGVSTFLDRDLRGGVFDDMLLRRITESSTFLIILTPNCLDRCSDEEDWLRKEIVEAIKSRRNIIPLATDSFQFTPEVVRGLDPAIRELSRYNAVEYSHVYFESTIERIVAIVNEDKAKSKDGLEIDRPNLEGQSRNWQRQMWAACIVAAVVLVAGALWLFTSLRHSHDVSEPPFPVVRLTPGTVTVTKYSKDGQHYVLIPPGTFRMGCSEGDSECDNAEKPHNVTITKWFWLGQTPVTQAAYQRVMGTNINSYINYYFYDQKSPSLPVESATWNQANAYCSELGMRLPTEAEWEYAARAGSDAARYGDPNAIAWYSKNSDSKTHEVRQKQPNQWTLYDMLGNVREWVGDWYDENYYQRSPSEDPKGPISGEARTVRGASWSSPPKSVRASSRFSEGPDFRNYGVIGFRCAREVTP